MTPIFKSQPTPEPDGHSRGRIQLTLAAAAGGVALVILLGFLFATTLKASPAVDISISPDRVSVRPGLFTQLNIAITNTGPITLTQIIVQAHDLSACGNYYSLPDLAPGTSISYTCWPSGYYENMPRSATVSAVPEGGGTPVSASDTVYLFVEHLQLSVTELQQIAPGQTADLQVVISNTGNFVVSDIAVTDTIHSSCSRPIGTLTDLNPNEMHSYTCQTDVLMTDFGHVISATAVLSDSTPLVDHAHYAVQITSPLKISQSPQRQVILPGTTGSISVTVQNSGLSTLTEVAVAAPNAPNCARPAGTLADLAPGGTHSYSCRSNPLQANLSNELIASATDTGVPVQARSTGFIAATPPIQINASPEIQYVNAGMTATFLVTVTNAFPNISLIDITVAAPDTPGCAKSGGELADLLPGGFVTYTCQSLINQDSHLHTMTVFASPFDGDPISDQAVVRAGQYFLFMPLSPQAGVMPPP